MFLLQTEIWPWLVSLTFPLFVVERQKPTRLEMRVALPNGEHLKSESQHGGPAHSALARDRTLKDKTEWEVLRVWCECVNARVNFRVVLTAAWAQAPPAAAKAGGAHVRRCSQYQTLKDRFCRRITAVYRRTYRFKPSLNPENVRLNKENSVDWHWGQSASKSSKTGERSSSSSELGWNRFIISSHFCDNNSHANHPKWANRFIMKTESQSLKAASANSSMEVCFPAESDRVWHRFSICQRDVRLARLLSTLCDDGWSQPRCFSTSPKYSTSLLQMTRQWKVGDKPKPLPSLHTLPTAHSHTSPFTKQPALFNISLPCRCSELCSSS